MFKQFLQDPSVPKKEKLFSLGEILKAMNVSETTSSLFGEPLNTGLRIYHPAPFSDTGLVVPENECMSYQLHFSGRDRHPPAVCKLLQSASSVIACSVLSRLRGLCFAEVLAENNRLNLVPKIAETFEDIIASARGQVKAIITTAEVSTAIWISDVQYVLPLG